MAVSAEYWYFHLGCERDKRVISSPDYQIKCLVWVQLKFEKITTSTKQIWDKFGLMLHIMNRKFLTWFSCPLFFFKAFGVTGCIMKYKINWIFCQTHNLHLYHMILLLVFVLHENLETSCELRNSLHYLMFQKSKAVWCY